MTLSDDGQWMWDGNQWVPAPPSAAPVPAPQPGFSDPNNQSWDTPQQFSRFDQPAAPHDTGEWSPQNKPSRRGSSIPMGVIIAVVILVVGGATGGILWATGVFGSSGDDLIGVWYDGDGKDGIQFKEDGNLVGISEGSPDSSMQAYNSFTWSVSGDMLTITATQHMLAESFECNNGDTVSRYYVNDGDEDCDGGEDEGVDVTKYPHDTYSFSMEAKYEIVGDVLFLGILKTTQTEDGAVETNAILESKICTSDESECSASVRASAMNNLNHATVVSGVTAPDWWVDTETYYDDYDY